MENATKALLIAGTVLVAIILISIAVYLYTLFSNQSKQYTEIMSSTELQKFNSNFDVYVGRNDITAQEIVSVVNLAKEYDYQIEIYLSTTKLSFNKENSRDELKSQEEFIKAKQDKLFSCTLNVTEENPNPEYDENGKMIKLKFTEN